MRAALRLGALDAAEAQAQRSFASIEFLPDTVGCANWDYRLPSLAATRTAVSMEALETVHAARADATGVEIRRGSTSMRSTSPATA